VTRLDQVIASRLTRPALGLVATCFLAAAAVCGLVGPAVVFHPTHGVVGMNPASDFQIMTWSLEWWPWAIRHGIDPFHTSLLWAPRGFSTVWMTSIPVPALLGLPITSTAGPLAAYNVMMVVAVVLAAAATFLLCLELSGSVLPSVLGGLVFALSPYMLGHTLSQHLDLTFVFPLPLLALLAVRFLRRRTSSLRFVLGAALALLALFGSSLELFVDLTLLIAVVLGVGIAIAPSWRRALARVAARMLLAYALILPILLPVAFIALGTPHAATQNAPAGYAVDLLNVVVPTPTVVAGILDRARSISAHFVGNIGERDGYLGLPLILVSLLGLKAFWRRGAWIAGLWILVALMLSLGPIITAGGTPLFRLPVSMASIPVLRDALPARMSLFVGLGIACLAALWAARPGRMALRIAGLVIVVLSLLPNFWPARHLQLAWATTTAFGWSEPRPAADFVESRRWARLVPAGSTVLVLPTRDRTEASYWQVESGMRFAIAVPETPFVPPALAASPTISRLAGNVLPQLDGPRLGAARMRAFLVTNRIRAVVVSGSGDDRWLALARAATSTQPVELGGSSVFPVESGLRPLRLNGERTQASSSVSRALIRAWLHFDGRRARLIVFFEGHGRHSTQTLSSPGADAEGTAVAVNARGQAAVAFTEWRGRALLLRVGTDAGRGWRVVTLERTTSPIWSQRVAITPSGAVVAAWVVEQDPGRALRGAVGNLDGRWHRPATLDNGDGLFSVALAAGANGSLVAAWRDSVAGQSRVLAAEYERRWNPVATVAASLSWLDSVSLTKGGGRIRWRMWVGRPRYFEAVRHGGAWSEPRAVRMNRHPPFGRLFPT
jgi:hypothetical protein